MSDKPAPRRVVATDRKLPPCQHCGGKRWKTIRKDLIWQCKKCGATRRRELTIEDVIKND